MNERTKLLGEEKMSKTLFIMGIPTMVGMLVSSLYNIVNGTFLWFDWFDFSTDLHGFYWSIYYCIGLSSIQCKKT